MLFLNVVRSIVFGRAPPVLPAAATAAVRSPVVIPSMTTPMTTPRGCSQFDEQLWHDLLSPSSSSIDRRRRRRRRRSAAVALLALSMTTTTNHGYHHHDDHDYHHHHHHMVTHDEDGPLGSAQESDFLGTIWIRNSFSARVVRRSARIRQLALNVEI